MLQNSSFLDLLSHQRTKSQANYTPTLPYQMVLTLQGTVGIINILRVIKEKASPNYHSPGGEIHLPLPTLQQAVGWPNQLKYQLSFLKQFHAHRSRLTSKTWPGLSPAHRYTLPTVPSASSAWRPTLAARLLLPIQ